MREPVRGVRAEVRYFFVALGYFTRVPVPKAIGYAAGDLDQAARYFPLVGACVGAWGALVYLAALRVLPASIAVGLSMAATLLATGAFHEDGLADSCDAFGGGYTRDDVLRIMHDSRIGTFGAVALIVALGLKWQALAAMPPLRAGVDDDRRACGEPRGGREPAAVARLRAARRQGEAGRAADERARRVHGGRIRSAVAVLAGLACGRRGARRTRARARVCGALFREADRRLYGRLSRLRAAASELAIYLVMLGWMSS